MRREADTPCRVCGGRSSLAFTGPVLGRDVGYYGCGRCGYLQTERPYWFAEAYASAINELDTGILLRNRDNVSRVVMTLATFGRLDGRVLDFAGGYGILVRLLRDEGIDAHWHDKYCENLLARGFEGGEGAYDLVTAFEVLEHLEHPLEDVRPVLEKAPVALFSTELLKREGDPPADWWYLGANHGQHVGFFRSRTLAWMARELGVHYASDGGRLHVFSRTPVPVSWKPLQRLRRLYPLAIRLAGLSPLHERDHDALAKSPPPGSP